MNADTLGRLRPRDTSSAAIRDTLTALQQERAATVQRGNAARSQRTTALIAGVSWQVGEADKVMKAAADDAEMLDAMEPALEEKLAFAERIEALGLAEVAEANEAADAAVQAYAAVLPKYARHAEAIAEIARLGEAAGQAAQNAEMLARKHGVTPTQFGSPGAVISTPTGYAIPLAALVRLPAPDGNGLLFGQWGAEHRPAPAFQYR